MSARSDTPKQDLTGQRFGRLTVISFSGWKYFPSGTRHQIWTCRCDCGNKTEATNSNLKSGHVQSCRCFQMERKIASHRTHGEAGKGKRTRLYRIWRSMVQRCTDTNSPNYQWYGAKGVKVHWKSFEEFRQDMADGYRDDLSIDRVNNDGDYCKSNCRWATPKQQSLNTCRNVRLEFRGLTKTMKEWSEELNLSYAVIQRRLALGWCVDKVLTHPVRFLRPRL
jgi:hypothetical protein